MSGFFGFSDMSPEDFRRLQLLQFDILLYFDGFCKRNGLVYFLAGGTLIGAVRHKGFIPWDDDIDLFMPREDYERLPILWEAEENKSNYKYCRTDEIHQYHNNGASIRDENTTEINRHSVKEDVCHGIALEILPIDGCPKSKLKRAFQLYNAFVFRLFNAQRLPDNKGKLIRAISQIAFLMIRSPRLRYGIWKRAERKMTQYAWEDCEEVTELTGSIKGMLIHHPKSDFERVVYKTFEGHQLPVMAGYERYLRLIWGDYMKLPPIEDRVAKHDLVYLSLTESYKNYKGIYYCVDQQ